MLLWSCCDQQAPHVPHAHNGALYASFVHALFRPGCSQASQVVPIRLSRLHPRTSTHTTSYVFVPYALSLTLPPPSASSNVYEAAVATTINPISFSQLIDCFPLDSTRFIFLLLFFPSYYSPSLRSQSNQDEGCFVDGSCAARLRPGWRSS